MPKPQTPCPACNLPKRMTLVKKPGDKTPAKVMCGNRRCTLFRK